MAEVIAAQRVSALTEIDRVLGKGFGAPPGDGKRQPPKRQLSIERWTLDIGHWTFAATLCPN
jgi:hypothetical protein